MDNQQILNTTITIESVEQKDSLIKLLAHDKKRYSFFTTKKDGTDTAVYAQFKTMGIKKDVSVHIGYVIDSYTDKTGQLREANKVINFREATQTPSWRATPRTDAPVSPQRESGEAFGKRLAIHGFVNALLSNGATIETVVKDLPALLRLEDEIEKVLNPSAFRKQVAALAPQIVEPDLPVIHQEEDEIPFFDEDVPV